MAFWKPSGGNDAGVTATPKHSSDDCKARGRGGTRLDGVEVTYHSVVLTVRSHRRRPRGSPLDRELRKRLRHEAHADALRRLDRDDIHHRPVELRPRRQSSNTPPLHRTAKSSFRPTASKKSAFNLTKNASPATSSKSLCPAPATQKGSCAC